MGLIPVGRVVSTHGIRGEVKFRYYNEVAGDFYGYPSLIFIRDGREVALKPVEVRPHKGIFLIRFQGLDTRESVDFLLQHELFVQEKDLASLEKDEYYEYQLIGLDVLNEGREKIGKVTEILHTGAHPIIVVSGKSELLVPMVDDFIINIDIQGSTMTVREDRLLV
jgi:16S rRNA processing protein RimM